MEKTRSVIEFINLFGIGLDDSAPVLIIFCAYYLILSVGVLLNVLNISMYLLSIYIVSNEKFLNKIPSKYVYLHKLITYYKNIRIGYIIFEVLLLLFLLGLMISISYGLVYFYFTHK